MMGDEPFVYYSLRQGTGSQDIDLLFPGWRPGEEKVVVLSPHDDDGVLGAGYAILAALANGAEVYVIIFCDGWAGYSTPEERDTIVARRRLETIAAYASLGVPEDRVLRFDYPDFSLWPWLGWHLPGGEKGTTARFLARMRALGPTRLLLPNGYREHMDHEAAFRVGAYDGPQIGDAILAEWGLAEPVRSTLQYAVWGDFSPEDALVSGAAVDLRANQAIVTSAQMEAKIGLAVRSFASQRRVIEGIMAARHTNRVRGDRAIELYLAFDPRPPLDYGPYHHLIDEIDTRQEEKNGVRL